MTCRCLDLMVEFLLLVLLGLNELRVAAGSHNPFGPSTR